MPLHPEIPPTPPRRRSPVAERANQQALAAFTRWCDSYDRKALPASQRVVEAYLIWLHLSGRSLTTLRCAAAAIRVSHVAHGHEPPDVRALVVAVRQAGPAPR